MVRRLLAETPRAAAQRPERARIRRAEGPTPLPDRLVGDSNTSLGQQIFRTAEAEKKALVEPDGATDDLGRESISVIVGRLAHHPPTLSVTPQLDNTRGPPARRVQPVASANAAYCRACSSRIAWVQAPRSVSSTGGLIPQHVFERGGEGAEEGVSLSPQSPRHVREIVNLVSRCHGTRSSTGCRPKLLDVRGLSFPPRSGLWRLGHVLHDGKDEIPEPRPDHVRVEVGVLERIVKQGGDDRIFVEAEI